ncbi:hypothetical protein DFJ43DRAFT_1043120 [Lentinula guzmanii]|uniref:Uncharacterized protein n=1 Tax=Lentinula guzmanii TaxID=2804957 RepID=A0AA38MWV4_9AGAR|nr:hypothetical protein DFJ43DRAFT_1043120 [Lentinula guzmanii]
MTPFSFYKIALLISFGILSLSFVCVDAGPVTKNRTQTVAENPGLRWTPFDPTEPMGYAYACVVYDQHGWFSDPTLSVLYVPEQHATNSATINNYIIEQGFEIARTIAFVDSRSGLGAEMRIPMAIFRTQPPGIYCEDWVQERTNKPIDWSSLLRAAGKPT